MWGVLLRSIILFCCFCGIFVSSQEFSPVSVPQEVVESAAEEKAAKKDASKCDVACAALASALPSKVFLAKEGNFQYWDSKCADLQPACRLEPESAQDVATAYGIVKEHECQFAIKSGGHGLHPGASNVEGGVVFDLSRSLNTITISADKKTVDIGPGARWLQVYEELEKDELIVLGGRVADVGVGGLILGGGISFYTAKQGFACDHVLEMEIVLPDGTITTASETNHADLFKALKGAGQSNFGIVTRFTLEAMPNPSPKGLWWSNRFFAWDKRAALSRAHTKYITEGLGNDASSLGQFQTWAQTKEYGRLIISNLWHTSHESPDSFPKTFEHYKEIEAWEGATSEMLPQSNVTIKLELSNPYGMRTSYHSFCYKPSAELEDKFAELFEEALEKIKDVDTWGFVIVQQPISRAAIAASKKRGGNAMGLEEEDGPLVIWHIPWSWFNAKDDELMRTVGRELREKSEEVAKEAGLWHRYRYTNYAEESQEAYKGYGEEMLKWLKQVQKKYDPEGIYTKGGLNSGYFKLNEKEEVVERIRDEL
ncbi:FAD-binding domain-containing protein [Rhizodiscina lignyota]|uniref:FAD-binding domain-containing protein n=1 Tax=Rhizodiscina lignyota TaxID=1504668 RepID=A0A9P4IRD2_9PEZI|nr:FAD-binding domain-containing protein [Rhizodiscina lignyota]